MRQMGSNFGIRTLRSPMLPPDGGLQKPALKADALVLRPDEPVPARPVL